MCSGLQRWLGLKRHCNGYDINCQYRKKFRQRILQIQKNFPTLSSIQLTRFPWTLPGIGKFHAPAHTATCRCKYSFNYLPGVGMTDGEAAERIWAILNNLSSRTKEMSSGHRHDVINDFHSDMNIRRVHGLRKLLVSNGVAGRSCHNPNAAELLVKRYKRAAEQKERASQHLQEIEECIPEEQLQQWRHEERVWEENVLHIEEEINFSSPYDLTPEKRMWRLDMPKWMLTERTRAVREGAPVEDHSGAWPLGRNGCWYRWRHPARYRSRTREVSALQRKLVITDDQSQRISARCPESRGGNRREH